MAKYKDIGGTTVGFRSGTEEYTYPSGFEGSIYYNSSNGKFQFVGIGTGTWSTGGNLNQVRGSNRGFGIQTAALTSGGAHENPGATPATQKTETYDGTSWTEVGDTNTGKQQFASFGVITAGFAAAGANNTGTPINAVESWNGSSWTETTEVNTARMGIIGCGSTTAGLIAGGYNPSPTLQQTLVELWNGSSWTEVTDLNTRRSSHVSAQQSPQTSTIVFGGYTVPPPNTANAETWNGSSWTEVGDLNSAKDNMGGTGSSSSDALAAGGRTINETEIWDGTSWTEVANLSLARGYVSSAGVSSSNALICGGEAPGSPYYKNNTEEWVRSHPIKTVTTS